jgi:hypothetical protein
MKPTLLLIAALGLAAGASPAPAAVPPDAPRAVVIFVHPEKFTDIKDRNFPTPGGETAILNDLRDFLVHEAKYRVPAGDKLTLTFTDIDLAGDFEPWRGPRFEDIRIIKDIYPPDFKFSYVLTDASGHVVKQGTEDLRDLAFEMQATIDTIDSLHYDKGVLSDWMRSCLRGVRTAGG